MYIIATKNELLEWWSYKLWKYDSLLTIFVLFCFVLFPLFDNAYPRPYMNSQLVNKRKFACEFDPPSTSSLNCG